MALRHIYLYLGSWPRLAEMMYWPMLNIALYGFISLSMVRQMGHVDVRIDAFLAGLMLAEVLTRAVMAMLVMYMEEVWSRNLGHLFASPMRLRDFVAGMLTLGVTRCLISVIPAFVVVYWLFHFSILTLGWNLPVYIALLCFNGCWYGLLIVSIILRFGLAAEWLGWMSTWLLMPFLAPYYPVAVLPPAFQAISWALPGTYVFESMKIQLTTGSARPDYLVTALFLNLGYFILAGWVFTRAFRSARQSGGLMQMGE
ncbi:MAG: ABC transporter permease [Alphaproteobacteria bacterium]|nr:ABC transporter permease [Alphaproteobacteria bacterium]